MATRLLSKAAISLCFIGIMNPCPAQDWVRMSGITDMFLEVKALSGTDTLIVSTAESGMYWTSDCGETWQELSTPTENIVSHEIFRNQGMVEILVVALTAPYLYRSTDMGQSWSPASQAMPSLQNHRLILDRYNRLWAFYGSQVYFSDNYGTMWDSVSVAPEVARVRNVWVSPQDSSKLWLAADTAGAYFSSNRGQTWTRSYVGGDVHDVEGNPQNPYSAIAIMYEDEMLWNHGDGIWVPLSFPVAGRYGDVVFLDNDSTQLLGTRGYFGDYTCDNIYHSSNGGQSWNLDAGPLISAGGWRIQSLGQQYTQPAVLLTGGALLGDHNWNNHWRLYIGGNIAGLLISRHQLGLIYGSQRGGSYISPDAGNTWYSTPFASSMCSGCEHTGRTALYVVKSTLEFFLLSYPSMEVTVLESVPEPTAWVYTSEADTSLLYCHGFSGNLYRNRQGGHGAWQMLDNPSDSNWICNLLPSSTDPGFATLASTPAFEFPPPRIWRTNNFGESWDLLFQSNFGGITLSWSGQDVLTNCYFGLTNENDCWLYYSTNGGSSFDSIRTGDQETGYFCWSWGDSVMIRPLDPEVDSIYVTPDYFQTLQFRLCYPEGVHTRLIDGHFSQIVSIDWDTDRIFYHGPYNTCPPQNRSSTKHYDLSMSIYPNPANSDAFIQLSGAIITDPIQIRIYDILGRQAGSFQIKSPGQTSLSLPLPINNLASGTYFVTLQGIYSKQLSVQKIVVLR